MRYDGRQLYILDQTLLPHEENWLVCESVDALLDMIGRLAIRGAPAIGISSSLLLGLLAEKGCSRKNLQHEALRLREARPTAVNLRLNIDSILHASRANDYPNSVVDAAYQIYLADIEQCRRIAENGAELIHQDTKILTHCHTGAIATAGSGTALGIIAAAHRSRKNIFVWIDETRPLLQGGRLTAWECLQLRIPHKIICDNMAAMLMAKGEVDMILVGSDRIAANGDFANKIGTYGLAVLANYHSVPFYVAAPQTTVDKDCPSGAAIPIEEREAMEVKGVSGSFGKCRWAPEQSEVFNPAFDVTPAELVTGWILDTGLFSANDLDNEKWWLGK